MPRRRPSSSSSWSLVACVVAVLLLAGGKASVAVPSVSTHSRDGDRDIVFSAQRYQFNGLYGDNGARSHGTPEERNLEETGPFHLYRVNPDGTGMTRLTNDSKADDRTPHWSPDGRTILFIRETPLASPPGGCLGSARSAICLIDPETRRIRTLLRLPVRETRSSYYTETNGKRRMLYRRERQGDSIEDCNWSPNGRYIALLAYTEIPYKGRPDYALVLDAASGRILCRVEGVTEMAWSRRDGALYLADVDGNRQRVLVPGSGALSEMRTNRGNTLFLRHLGWVGDATTGVFVGDTAYMAGDSSWVYAFPPGRGMRQITWDMVTAYTRADKNSKDERASEDAYTADWFSGEKRRWFGLPALGPNAALAEGYHARSDGGQRDVFRADLRTGKAWLLHRGQLVAVAPDGLRCAVATDDWTGPYKRGGARCGPLEIVRTDLPPGRKVRQERAITPLLMYFRGGDWRRPRGKPLAIRPRLTR